MLEQVMILAQAAADGAAAAAPAAKQQSGLEGLLGMAPLFIIVIVMFYLMYRSQKKEQAKRAQMIDSVRAGSKVLTVGGIIGVITLVKETTFELEIAKNLRVDIAKSAIANVIQEDGQEGKESGEIVKK